ncbi:hypothetical protein [Dongshaea marina]|uniref:hypothetical protein n=1 Tax=Dongshaea marina TaxID=2047966 RepID=UPI000D3E5B7D|nr:hypothetical protein [Dongshaea marina]
MKIQDSQLELSGQQVLALERLKELAMQRRCFGELAINLWHHRFRCDLHSCINALSQETDNRLSEALYLMLDLARQGIKSNQYLGDEFAEGLIERWELHD